MTVIVQMVGQTCTNCTEDEDECLGNVCLNSGNCTNTIGSFTCKCTPFWKGLHCELVVEEGA